MAAGFASGFAAAGLAASFEAFDDALCACAGIAIPHTSTLSPRAVSIRCTDMTKTGSLIIVTGRWPDIFLSHGRWIAGKCLFGKAVRDRRPGTSSAFRPRRALLLPLRVGPGQEILGAGTAQLRAAILHHHLAIDVAG